MSGPDLSLLPGLLRARGVTVVESSGWLGRGYDTFAPVGQMNHHTAIAGPCTLATADAMIRGRPDLSGPLCNGLGGLDRRGGFVVYLIAGRRARHAGPGSARVLSETGRDVAPSGDARARGLSDDSSAGNRSYFGWEWQHPGDASPWPDVFLDGIGVCNATLAELAEWTPARSIHHREWTGRKIDMSWRGDLRALVARHMEDGDMPLNDEDKQAVRAIVREEIAAAMRFAITGEGNSAVTEQRVGGKWPHPVPGDGTAAPAYEATITLTPKAGP